MSASNPDLLVDDGEEDREPTARDADPARDTADLISSLRPALALDAERSDEPDGYPAHAMAELAAQGYLGLLVPKVHGGLGGDLSTLAEVAFRLATESLPTAFVWSMHCQQTDGIARFGSPALAADVLRAVASGRSYLGSVTTERSSGSSLFTADAALADRDGHLVVERRAPVVSGGRQADAFLVTMRDHPLANPAQVTLVYVGRAQADVRVVRALDHLGMRGVGNVELELAASVPASQVVGERGRFRDVAIESMAPVAHIAWSACWLGALSGAYRRVVGAARDGSLSLNDVHADRLARVRIELEVATSYLRATAAAVDALRTSDRSVSGVATQIQLNTLKVHAAETSFRSADRLIELVGFAGYERPGRFALERTFRDLRSASLTIANDRLLATTGRLCIVDRGPNLLSGFTTSRAPS